MQATESSTSPPPPSSPDPVQTTKDDWKPFFPPNTDILYMMAHRRLGWETSKSRYVPTPVDKMHVKPTKLCTGTYTGSKNIPSQ